MFKRNIKITPKKTFSAWDKVSVGSWTINGDSQVYCEFKMPVEKAEAYIAKLNNNSQEKITITHFVGATFSRVLRDCPDLNVMMRFSKIYYRDEVNIFFHISDKSDLSGHCIKNIDKLSVPKIAGELNSAAKKVRSHNDPAFKKIKNSWSLIPIRLSKLVLGFIRFVIYGLNIHVKSLGVPQDAFGSMMITNIGSLGFDSAYVPLAPYTQVPIICALGKVKYEPVCDEKGNIKAEKIVSLNITFDHRILDGYRGSLIAKQMRKYFDDPELL